jgi:putative NADPH-quinone reductase
MRVFIVHAHHEPKSFNGAMTETALTALGAAGNEIRSEVTVAGKSGVLNEDATQSRAQASPYVCREQERRDRRRQW